MTFALTIDPNAVLDITWDWTDWLAASETISTKTCTVTPASSITVGTPTETGGVVTAFVSAATLGTVPRVTCRITTSQGRTDDRTFRFTVIER